jgi:enolase-phosphatase E1
VEFKGVKYVLMDIEGTVSDINFVKEVMFPYSKEKLPQYLEDNANKPEVAELAQQATLDELMGWIENDVKHPVLKKLQGMIWKEAFEKGAFKAPLYKDVLPAWKKWEKDGFLLGIYSSGSSTAQKMFFSHTTEGNLLNYLKNHFDLEVGSKKEVESYKSIAEELALPAKEILFLSDVPEELEAAEKAEFQVAHIVRPGTKTSSYTAVHSFDQLELQS